MKPEHRLPAVIGALAAGLAVLGAGTVLIVGATLEPPEREAVAAALAPRAMLAVAVWLAALAAMAWGAARLFARHVEAPHRLHEQAQALLANPEAPMLAPAGSAATRGLAEVVNALAEQRLQARRDVARQVADASRGIEQERSRLSALMAELAQAVVVCNLDGRILLYNGRARAQCRAWSRTPQSAGGAELIGLGRSIYSVFAEPLIAHALETVAQRLRSGATPSAQFVTSAPGGQLLRVQMAAVREPAAAGGLGGFVLMLDDITRDLQQDNLRDQLLLGLTEQHRASLGTLQAAVEALARPGLEAPRREQLQAVVRDEVGAMSERLQTLARDVLAGLRTRWPLDDMRGADLVAAAQRRIEALGAVRVDGTAVDASVWLRVDSYALVQALTYLAGRLVDDYAVKALQLRLQPAGERAQLDLVWSGPAMSTETVMSWQMEPMATATGGSPLTVHDVVARHGGEFGFARERVRHESFFRFLLPRAAQADAAAAEMPAGGARPEFYDFDLFQPSMTSHALEDRPLDALSFTVFDTETTGLDPSGGDEIVQIGAVRIINGRLLRGERFEQLVDPQRPLAEAAIAVHGIRPEALAGQPTILDVLPVFHAFARETVLVAHNAAFDMRFLQLKEAATGLRFDQPVLDTMLLSAWVHPNQASHRLEAIAERLGVAVTGRHAALGDALVTAEVFLRLIPLLQAQGVSTLGQARDAARQTDQARLRY